MAESAALTWRVSSSVASYPAFVSPAWSHWLSGPASSPILVTKRPSSPQNATSVSGSVAILASCTIFPVASTTQTLLCFNETSMPI